MKRITGQANLSKLMMKQGLEEMGKKIKFIKRYKRQKTFGSHERQRLDGTRHSEEENCRVRLKRPQLLYFNAINLELD